MGEKKVERDRSQGNETENNTAVKREGGKN